MQPENEDNNRHNDRIELPTLENPGRFHDDLIMDITGVVFPVFAVAILGYLLTWAGAFRPEDVPGLTRYVFNVALPVLLFDSMSTVRLPETISWAFLLAYYLPTLTVYFLGAFAGARFFGQNRTEQGTFAMGCAYSNTVLIGLPVVSTAWGDEAVLPLMMIVSVHTAVLFTLTTAVAESGGPADTSTGRAGRSRRQVLLLTALGMLRNPIFGGLVIGLIFNLAGFTLPGPAGTMVRWIRGSALPAALFVTGASLRQYRVMGHSSEAGTILVLKLLIHPLLVALAVYVVFDIPPLWAAVAVLTASLPTGVNASVFAGKYRASVAPVVTATLLSTLLSIITLSVLLACFGPNPAG